MRLELAGPGSSWLRVPATIDFEILKQTDFSPQQTEFGFGVGPKKVELFNWTTNTIKWLRIFALNRIDFLHRR